MTKVAVLCFILFVSVRAIQITELTYGAPTIINLGLADELYYKLRFVAGGSFRIYLQPMDAGDPDFELTGIQPTDTSFQTAVYRTNIGADSININGNEWWLPPNNGYIYIKVVGATASKCYILAHYNGYSITPTPSPSSSKTAPASRSYTATMSRKPTPTRTPSLTRSGTRSSTPTKTGSPRPVSGSGTASSSPSFPATPPNATQLTYGTSHTVNTNNGATRYFWLRWAGSSFTIQISTGAAMVTACLGVKSATEQDNFSCKIQSVAGATQTISVSGLEAWLPAIGQVLYLRLFSLVGGTCTITFAAAASPARTPSVTLSPTPSARSSLPMLSVGESQFDALIRAGKKSYHMAYTATSMSGNILTITAEALAGDPGLRVGNLPPAAHGIWYFASVNAAGSDTVSVKPGSIGYPSDGESLFIEVTCVTACSYAVGIQATPTSPPQSTDLPLPLPVLIGIGAGGMLLFAGVLVAAIKIQKALTQRRSPEPQWNAVVTSSLEEEPVTEVASILPTLAPSAPPLYDVGDVPQKDRIVDLDSVPQDPSVAPNVQGVHPTAPPSLYPTSFLSSHDTNASVLRMDTMSEDPKDDDPA